MENKKKLLENIELRSDEIRDVLEKAPSWPIRFGNLVILLLLVMVLGLSWFIKYPDSIETTALVTSENPPQNEYARVSGKISAFLVEDNQFVKPRAPLAVIQNTAKYEDVFYLISVVDSIDVNKRPFFFPIDEVPVLLLGDVDPDYSLFESRYIEYILQNELKPFLNEKKANSESRAELLARMKSLQEQRDLFLRELEYRQKDLDRNKQLFDNGAIAEKDFERSQLTFNQAQRNYKNIDESISQYRELLSSSNRTSREIEINQISQERTLLRSVLQSFSRLKRSLENWRLKYLLESDLSGYVTLLNHRSANQYVNQGDLVFTVVPRDQSKPFAILEAPPDNSGKVKVGQKVQIQLSNYPMEEFGLLEGEIVNTSLVANKDGNYVIKVQLSKGLITSYDKEIEFKQEMRGTARIITEDLRLLERILYRVRGLFSQV